MNSNNFKDFGLAFLRIGSSALMLTHGYGKLQLLINNDQFGDPIGIGSTPTLFLAVISEVVCPILIIFGFKTRWAAILPALTMAIAFFIVHAADPFKTKEKALMYLIAFIAIILLGPGKYSIDKK